MSVDLNRRAFLKTSLAAGVGVTFASCSSGNSSKLKNVSKNEFTNFWVHIPQSGSIEFTCPRTEMGQGISTGHAALLCESLDYPLDQIVVKNAPGDRAYNHQQFQTQMTGGSTSTNSEWRFILNIGESIRHALLKAASQKTGLALSDLSTEAGYVVGKGQRLSYQSLSKEIGDSTIEEKEFDISKLDKSKYIGKKVNRVDGQSKIRGVEAFGIDTKNEEMTGIKNPLVAVVVGPPIVDAEPISCNEKELLEVEGVKHIVKISTGFAIVADKYWQILKAKKVFKGKWKNPKTPFDTKKHYAECLDLVKDYDGSEKVSEGESYKSQDMEVEAVYSVPYLAHAPLEPQNCTVDITEDSARVWYSTQGPGMVKPILSEISGISEDKIEVRSASVGGGFGRKAAYDSLVKAAEVGTAIKKPVKLLYSREDDMMGGYYRPQVVTKMKASMNKDGKDIYYKQAIATQSIMADTMPDILVGVTPSWVSNGISRTLGRMMVSFTDGQMAVEGAEPPYAFKGSEISWQKTQTPIKVQWWRSVGHSQNGFFIESFMDEVAHKLGQDPMQFREERLKDIPRQRAVLQQVKKMANWDDRSGRHLGVATHFSFQSYTAAVIEVETVDEELKIKNVWASIDCGRVLNPDAVHAQVMGSCIFGLTAALYGKIDINEGRIAQQNFDTYQLMSMANTPHIETHIMESKEEPTGVGEPIVPIMAPALCNAIFTMNGKRHRDLPVLG